MAQLHRAFDANQVDPAASREPIPEGWYKVMMTESEMKPTKARDGYYLETVMQVVEGPHKGRLLWDRLNLVNKNATAVAIAERTLSAICHATGKMSVTDSAQLHNIPMEARVTFVPAKGEYKAKNEIDGYRRIGSAPAVDTPAPAQPASTQTAAAPAASAPPWAKPAA